ncbi:MAG: hypothetical protein MUE68_00315 [Bacteroidetes bacterium]|jgi:hypothetical protein|nr:hypothetical protein [Bacteroidota bacterium]
MRHSFLSLSLLLAGLSCSPEPEGPLDALAAAPAVVSLTPTAVTVDSDTINVGSTRQPTDRLSIPIAFSAVVQSAGGSSPVGQVTGWIVDDRGLVVSGPTPFNDGGVAPDLLSGDGTFSGYVRLSITRVEIGSWSARVAATGVNGMRSTIAVIPLTVVRNNRPPIMSSLVADATISASDPQPLMLLQIKAVDPDGPSDILRVYFNSYRPNGLPASGNPFLMFDDGNSAGISGDALARDSVYSLRVQFGGAPTGTYRFEFRAIDRSSDSSNIVIHRVEVLP